MLQIAVLRDTEAFDVVRQLFVNIDQRGRDGDAFADGKRQPVRLPCAVIRVLSQNHNFDVTEFGCFKGVEHVFGRRIDNPPHAALVFDGFDDVLKIGFGLFRADCFVPSLHIDAFMIVKNDYNAAKWR